jgi:hypothetical protein
MTLAALHAADGPRDHRPRGTALPANKDLAVSARFSHTPLLTETSLRSDECSLGTRVRGTGCPFPFEKGRFCSHLLHRCMTGVTRYHTPKLGLGRVRTFLPFRGRSSCGYYYAINQQKSNYTEFLHNGLNYLLHLSPLYRLHK